MKMLHVRILPQVKGVDIGGERLDVYKVSIPWILNSVKCLVEECLSKIKKREG